MKKLFLLLILSFFSTTGFSASCPDLSEPTRTVSADGSYYIYTCDNSSNKVASYYNLKKQDAIKKTIEQVAGNYAMWGINVTTDRTVFDDAGKRARILVVNRGDYAGLASTDGISTSSKPTGYVDSLSIFKPRERGKCAYLLTHEVGHNFRLRGTTNDYAVDYPDATIGAFMGGRTKDRFTGYQWKRILNKKGEWQDPPEYFQNAINK